MAARRRRRSTLTCRPAVVYTDDRVLPYLVEKTLLTADRASMDETSAREVRSWLCRDGVDRERMLDMDLRLQPVRRNAFVVLGAALLACGPWLGYWTIVPLLIASAIFRVADSRTASVARPEYAMFAAWATSEVIIGASVALTGGPKLVMLGWFAIPIVTLSARFSARGIVFGVVIALALLVTVAFATGTQAVLHNPPLVIGPAALIIAVAMLSTALMHSDVEHRSEAVIDCLTGMLNRHALAGRTSELSQQSEVSGEPIGIIVGDLDHFKEINDSYGHTVGDAVLADVAYVMRKQLRAFDLAYRLGGEEFLVLLPGADIQKAASMAEQLRQNIATQSVGDGHRVTISFGVSASAHGTRFDYATVFTQADRALYEAKRDGRDRVRLATPVPHPPPPGVPSLLDLLRHQWSLRDREVLAASAGEEDGEPAADQPELV
jgi:diguanylate cyclase (GGDEF)-like protein